MRVVDTPARETKITLEEYRDESMRHIPSMRELEDTHPAGKEGDENEVVTKRFKKKEGQGKRGREF